jgi:biopolymer transport protein ExbD
MRFKQQRNTRSLPELNLVPMLDVLMTVLTFFIVISMTLALEQGVEVQLPRPDVSPSPQSLPDPLIVELTPQGLLLNRQLVDDRQTLQQVQAFLAANPGNTVALKVEPQMPYERVMRILADLKAIGGERVSLAIE